MAESLRPNSIFLSYRRADSEEMVDRIYEELTGEFGTGSVFRDIDNIPAGVDFAAYIQQSLNGCPIILVFIGRDWLSCTDESGRRRLDQPDDHVRIEVETALTVPDARVIPVLVKHAQMPRAEEVPPSLRPLLRRNCLAVRGSGWDYKQDMVHLRQKIAAVISDILPVRDTAKKTAPGQRTSPENDVAPAAFPVPLTCFFGREEELAALTGWLQNGQRLVTLTGAGGTGKTRLSLEVARHLSALPGWPAFYVPLSDLHDARFLARRVRDTLLPTAAAEDQAPAGAEALEEQIAAVFRAAPSLLILDNYEQLVESGAEFVARLLARASSLACLVTSRRRLDLSGEREFALSPLAVPPGSAPAAPLARLEEYASVRLFRDRAQAVRGGFALNEQNAEAVAELCRKVEGIPLAIELAAARVEMLTPQQIVKRLARSLDFLVGGQRDVAARHRTLRATLDWSFELLTPDLRTFFARLSVFRGGWTAEAALALAETTDPDEALLALSTLRRASLILAAEHGDAMRYQMLETLRQYAAEQLARSGEKEAERTRARHRDFFLALAHAAEPELRKGEQAQWLDLLETEHENFRAALHSIANGEPAQLHLAYCLHRFWMIHNHLVEGREWFARALATTPNQAASCADPLVAKAGNAAGVLAWAAGDLAAARAHLERSRDIFQALGDLPGTASALNNLGLAADEQSDFTTARARYEASLALYRQLETPALLAAVLNNLGRTLIKECMYADARKCLEESLALQTTSADRFNLANILASLGEIEAAAGQLTAAYQRFEECLTIRLGLGDTNNFEVYWQLATLCARHGNKEEAARLLGAAETVQATRSLRLATRTAARFQNDVDAVAKDLGTATFTRAWEQGKAMSGNEIAQFCRQKILDLPPPRSFK